MTLENINYVAQTIGVLAILASLVFVGIQVRQNTEQARRARDDDARLARRSKQGSVGN